ncbi:MAG: ABC transporter permease subunit [Phycisphaeraceae bacterium]|nr:ABC transporter permease subunit [Phycisphaeraceae bacterium]
MESPVPSPVVCLDYVVSSSGPTTAVLHENGKLFLESVEVRRNLLTGTNHYEVSGTEIPYAAPPGRGKPDYFLLSGLGDNLFIAWRDGTLLRFDLRDPNQAAIVETVKLIDDPKVELTSLKFIIGRSSLVAGDSSGRVRVWFRIKPDGAATADGSTLVAAHELHPRNAAVTALASSTRSRIVAIGYADGHVRLEQVTSGKLLAELDTAPGQPVRTLVIAPKEDGLIAGADDKLWRWSINPRHPETTLAALFRPVWYEGYNTPEHVWQSSAGTDDFEPKFGLYPLVFGTIKATAYSMLFGVPLALLAAIYSSEFLHPKIKARVKPTIELMASLPSVVLGFLAGLVIAPFVESVVPALLATFLTVPVCFLLGAYLWQMLPQHIYLRYSGWRFLMIALTLPLAILLAVVLGPALESVLFAGDFRAWLNWKPDADPQSPFRNGAGGWVLILTPVCGIAVALLVTRVINPRTRALQTRWSRRKVAMMELIKFVFGVVVTGSLALALGQLLAGIGLDSRGGVIDTYVQRNALVVGFIMGFAIIPIIYTIAEDALSTVPDHLRAASLGAGATPWQTATRIIIPTAMSGLFSALMIGLGRAVGETMIVLMAAGNTPVMEWNIFNGFRTLSANIAVELPEAVVGSTHYRTLFLAALTLFAMTFVVNTLAEAVRQRFRKRAFQL